VLFHKGETTQGLLKIYWPVAIAPDQQPQEVRTLGLLASVMHLKLLDVVRERLGASYAPSAGFSSSSIYPGLNYLYADIEAKPEDLMALRAAVRAIAADMREGVFSQDELERARTPALEQLAQHASANIYWLTVIAQLQTRPDRVQRLALDNVESGLRSVTLADLRSAAGRWLLDGNLREIDILPAAGEDD
jgi:zinc protease